MTIDIDIRLAQPADAEAIAGMLAKLARDLGDGDASASTPEVVRRFGFGPKPAFSCFLASNGTQLLGLALFFRHFSTTLGLPGAYVQDLWVAPGMRGRKVGVGLLGAVARYALREWQAGYLKLTVSRSNTGASRFYQKLGFAVDENVAPMSVTGAAFRDLAHQKGTAA